MTYEYMAGLGDPPKDQIPVTVSTQQPASQTPVSNSNVFQDEAQGVITHLRSLIERVRSGDQEAVVLLRGTINHHDWQENVDFCRQFSEGRITDLSIDRQTVAEFCDAVNLAVQVAEGNDPQRRRNAMIAAGVGAGALVLATITYLVVKR